MCLINSQSIHEKIVLENSNTKVGREIFRPKIRNKAFHEIGNINGVRLINFATSKI